MKKQIKQILAGVLVLTLLVSCQLPVFAEDVQDTQETVQVTDEIGDATDVVAEAEAEEISEGEEMPEVEESESKVVVLDGVEEAKDKTLLYVATDGKDSNPGTIDKPLATLTGARDKVRELKKNNQLADGGAVVYFRGGQYTVLNRTSFQEEDSGEEGAPIVYRNYPDEEVEFVGGAYLKLEQFKPVEDKDVLERIVDTEARKKIVCIDLFALGFTDIPEQLWPGTYSYYSKMGEYLKEHYGIEKPAYNSPEFVINGKGATLARYPNEGDMEIGDVVQEGNFENTDSPAEFALNDARLKYWTKAEDAILYGTFWYTWASLASPLGGVNVSKNTIKTKYPIYYGAAKGQLFYIYNLIEELDMPGEYYIDRKKGILYFYPPEESIDEMVYTLHTGSMFSFVNAHHIVVKGIDMKYSRGNFVGIEKKAKNIQIIDCEFTFNSTAGAVSINGSESQVYDCYFHDCSMGIVIYSGDRATLTRGNVVVENCKFERCDRKNKSYSPALYIMDSVGVRASYNDISEAEQNLIQFGGNLCEFSFNDIYDGVTNADDMGAIYSGRNLTMTGNVFKNNYVHDIGGKDRGVVGIFAFYFDDHWSAADVVGNVIANVSGSAATMAGSHNVFHNNILINVGQKSGRALNIERSYNYGNAASVQPLIDSVNAMPIHSKVWTDTFPELANVLDEDGQPQLYKNIVVTDNVLYDTPLPYICDEAMETATYENNVSYKSSKDDIGFFDLENEIYHLKEDSRVYTDIPGFKPIPFTRIGRYDERAIARAAKGFVFCTDSPYVIKDGERVKTEKNQAIVNNETIYVPLRTASDAIEGKLTYEEENGKISVSAKGKLLEFTDGATNEVSVSGMSYTLSKPIVNIDGSNYIAVADVANIFGMHLVHYSNLTVLSDEEELFHLEADSNILRYLETILTLY